MHFIDGIPEHVDEIDAGGSMLTWRIRALVDVHLAVPTFKPWGTHAPVHSKLCAWDSVLKCPDCTIFSSIIISFNLFEWY